ncbi:MAG: hypothetical protein KDK70_41920, partial [Myxococcales bacterium]|nr:hypothetical protein [Myxococcales bacterium]
MASRRAGERVGMVVVVMVAVAGLLGPLACTDDETTPPNTLPTTSGSGTASEGSGSGSGADATADTTAGGAVTFPATYR